jgi:hypothetical protein
MVNDDKDQQHEVKEERYVEDLILYYQTYVSAVINEIFVGIGISLGQSEKQAYAMIKTDPKKLEKAFFKDVFDKFKNVFKHRIPKFRIKQNVFNNGKPLSEKQWETINKSITDYWKQNTADITEDVVTKAYVLGIKSSKYRKSKIDNTKKTLPEIIKNNPIPDKFAEAYKRYDFKNSEKNAMNKAFSSIAMYVSDTGDGIKQAIRKNITEGINEGKTPVQIASDMYWNIQKETGQQTAESVRKNWNRISATEMNSVFEAGILAPEEGRAMESLKTGKGVYFVRTGGTCSFCVPLQGTIVRLLPESIVDRSTDSLKEIGIDDPITDTYIWIGKNNIGRKRPEWWNCVPGHPWNRATYQPFNPDTQEYEPKFGRVVDKVPESLRRYGIKRDTSFATPEYKESKKPVKISDNLVRFYDSIYEAVDREDYSKKLEQWKKDPSLPIPVSRSSTDYKQIFGNAK